MLVKFILLTMKKLVIEVHGCAGTSTHKANLYEKLPAG
jgi:hypothetical protein